MSQIRKGIFRTLAIAATFGAVQFASGHDLIGSKPDASTAPGTAINRAAKADRATVPPSPGRTETISFRPDSLADTSVLVRIPAAKEARNETRDRPAPPSVKSGVRKTTLACEPVVSVLTEVAKLLQPGRCVT
jgi:hypothetical protein